MPEGLLHLSKCCAFRCSNICGVLTFMNTLLRRGQRFSVNGCRYGYYFASSLGFRSNAIKKIITTSQMVQFVAFMSQVRAPDCAA